MVQVLLGIGSNINREHYVTVGLDALEQAFGKLRLSSVFESDAIGFQGDAFYNLVVSLETSITLGDLARAINQIEVRNGRDSNATKFSSRTLDIDILTYGNAVGLFEGIRLPRSEITENAYVLRPLAELAPTALHPILSVEFATLWVEFDARSQRLWPVDFVWHQKIISRADSVEYTSVSVS